MAVTTPDARSVEFTIRPMVAIDLATVLAINEANVPEVSSISMEQLEFLVEESACSLVVDVDGTVAGFCIVLGAGSAYDSVNYRWFMDRYTDAMYLDRVAFTEEFRGQGLGTALYDEVHEFVRARAGHEPLDARGQRRSPEPAVPGVPPSERIRGGRPAAHALRDHGLADGTGRRAVTLVCVRISEGRSSEIPTQTRIGTGSAAVLEEAEVVAGGGDVSASMSASRIVSPPAPVASISPSGSMIRAVAGVVEAAARADAVDADDVRLVLDRPRLQQRRPVQPPRRRPVGRHEVARRCRAPSCPELVGEAQVVADEQADPQALDVDGDELGRRRGSARPRRRR